MALRNNKEEEMEILGYVGYAILIFFAVTWALGIRVKLGVGLFTIMGALFYMAAAILLGVLEINKLHSWWLLPSGFIFVTLCSLILAHRVPVLCTLVKILGSVYAGIIRLGIPSERIRNAQLRDAYEPVYGSTDEAGLIQAARDDDLETVRSLLASGVDVNMEDYDGRTALGWAAYKGHTEICRFLVENGADVEAKSKKGITPLMLAADQSHMRICMLLLEKGADIDAKTTDNGQTALMTAASKRENGAIVTLLLENGAEVNMENDKGATALLVAACTGDSEIVKILLEKGADVNASTQDGLTALLVAGQNGHTAVVRLLEEAGAM